MSTRVTQEVPDRTLADAVLADGDEHAFRELYRRHTPRLFQFALRILGGEESAAHDVVQETWIRAASALDGFRWEARFDTWITGIALNLGRNHLRARARRREVPEQAATGGRRPPPRDVRIDLERAIARLPDGYRTVLVLHDVEGWKHREIAGRLGIAEGTSKSQLAMARRAMRTLLEPEDEGEEAR